MDESLQHDPRTKMQIKDAIYGFLYEPILKQFQRRLDEIIVKNCILLNSPEQSFIYKGKVYATVGYPLPRIMNRLSKQLFVHMDEYLHDLKQLNNYELPYVLGFIGQVLNASNHLPDYLKVLPPAVHQPIAKLINTCPCRSVRLTEAGILELQKNNTVPISLIKQRMVTNLLI